MERADQTSFNWAYPIALLAAVGGTVSLVSLLGSSDLRLMSLEGAIPMFTGSLFAETFAMVSIIQGFKGKEDGSIPLTPKEDLWKRVKYEGSLAYTELTIWFSSQKWWNPIEGHPNLLLGAIPLSDKGHIDALKDPRKGEGIQAILSCIESFEQKKGWIHTPVTARDWGPDIVTQRIEAQDFLPMKPDEIDAGVAFLHAQISAGKKTYVHCKAGRGRSATVVIAYLMKHHNMRRKAAFGLVKTSRSQINLNPRQWGALTEYKKKLSSS